MAGRFLCICLIGGGLFCSVAAGQSVLSLSKASARTGSARRPAHQGEQFTVEGVVAAGPLWVPDYEHAATQDESGAGLTLEIQRSRFPDLQPGMLVRVTGILHERAGL